MKNCSLWKIASLVFYNLAALIAPLLICRMRGQPYGELLPGAAPACFKAFIILITIEILGICFIKLRGRKRALPVELISLFTPALVCFFVLSYLSLSYQKPYDYLCYENAAASVLEGGNPYGSDKWVYLYPPFTAQLMAGLYHVVEFLPIGDNVAESGSTGWDAVFYLFQCGQFFAVVLMYFLCRMLLRFASMGERYSSILSGLVIICNFPLMLTLRNVQVNIWVLDLILFAVMFLARRPVLAGFALAIGAHIKLYPFALLLPWILKRRVTAIVSAVVAFAMIVYMQTGFGRHWTLWKQFAGQGSRLSDFPRGNSIYTGIQSAINVFAGPLGLSQSKIELTAGIMSVAVTVALLGWFLIRFIHRERNFRDFTGGGAGGKTSNTETFKMISHCIDALIFGLLASSSVGRHHYLLVVPAILWGFSSCCGDKKMRMAMVGFLILCVPRLYIFPLRYLPLAAILYMLYICPFDEICADRFEKV